MILNYIYKFCDNSASQGGLEAKIYLSQLEKEIGSGQGIWYKDTTLEARDDLTHIGDLLEKEGLKVGFQSSAPRDEDTLIKVSWSVWNDWKEGETHE